MQILHQKHAWVVLIKIVTCVIQLHPLNALIAIIKLYFTIQVAFQNVQLKLIIVQTFANNVLIIAWFAMVQKFKIANNVYHINI